MRSLTLVLTLTLTLCVHGQEWSRFRGPNGSGVSDATSIPTTWTDKDYLWKVPLPGVGHSSPVVWGDKVFVTAGDKSGKRLVLCLDAATGKTLWQKEFLASAYKMHVRNSIATSTPAADAERLYVAWATPDRLTLMALDHQGQTVWQNDLGTFKSQHGFGVSPIVFNDLVILPNDQDNGGSILAFEAKTGKVRWTASRKPKNATYSTPCVYQPRGRPPELIFTNWQHGVTALDPKTGKTTWEISVFEVNKQERAIASPVVAGDLILSTCGFVTAQKHFVAVKPPEGTDAKPAEVWRAGKGRLVFADAVGERRSRLPVQRARHGDVSGGEDRQDRLAGARRRKLLSIAGVCRGSRLLCRQRRQRGGAGRVGEVSGAGEERAGRADAEYTGDQRRADVFADGRAFDGDGGEVGHVPTLLMNSTLERIKEAASFPSWD